VGSFSFTRLVLFAEVDKLWHCVLCDICFSRRWIWRWLSSWTCTYFLHHQDDEANRGSKHLWNVGQFIWGYFLLFPVPVCAITASGVPGGTLDSMNSFSTLCGWLVQRQGWRVKGWMWSREQARSAKPNSWLDYLWLPEISGEVGDGRRGNERNFVYSSLWDFKSSFTCRKILRHGTFPLYFPSERKVCCGFLSPLKIHLLGRVLNPQPLGPVASTLTTTPPRRLYQATRLNSPEDNRVCVCVCVYVCIYI
jgi:hypothetical protein